MKKKFGIALLLLTFVSINAFAGIGIVVEELKVKGNVISLQVARETFLDMELREHNVPSVVVEFEGAVTEPVGVSQIDPSRIRLGSDPHNARMTIEKILLAKDNLPVELILLNCDYSGYNNYLGCEDLKLASPTK